MAPSPPWHRGRTRSTTAGCRGTRDATLEGGTRPMASFDPQDFGLDEPPPRPTTPPVRRGFVVILLVLCFLAALVYGIPYVAERTGYAWETGRSRAAVETLGKLDKAGVINRSSAL